MTLLDLASRRGPWLPEIHRALASGVEAEVFPGGQAAVVHGGELVHASFAGNAALFPAPRPARADTIWDLASLTKVLATTPLAAVLVGQGAMRLDDPVSRWLPEFTQGAKARVTVRHLLAHASGLPAWRPYFIRASKDPTAGLLFGIRDETRKRIASARGRAVVRELALAEPLEREPGAAAVYSDIGFLVLGAVLEAASAQPLDRACRELVFARLGLRSLHFRPLDGDALDFPGGLEDAVAATGTTRPREPAPGQQRELTGLVHVADTRVGEVDDDNAYAMGGVAPHAGLFGHARDVAAFGQAVVAEAGGAGRLAQASVWKEFLALDASPGSTRALGFDTASAQGSAAGSRMTAGRTVGHTGFTGTSLWIDLARGLSVALLTNRVHPSRANVAIQAFRPAFHDAVVEALSS